MADPLSASLTVVRPDRSRTLAERRHVGVAIRAGGIARNDAFPGHLSPPANAADAGADGDGPHYDDAGTLRAAALDPDGAGRAGAADRVRERGQPAARARRCPARGAGDAPGARRIARTDTAPAGRREPRDRARRRGRRCHRRRHDRARDRARRSPSIRPTRSRRGSMCRSTDACWRLPAPRASSPRSCAALGPALWNTRMSIPSMPCASERVASPPAARASAIAHLLVATQVALAFVLHWRRSPDPQFHQRRDTGPGIRARAADQSRCPITRDPPSAAPIACRSRIGFAEELSSVPGVLGHELSESTPFGFGLRPWPVIVPQRTAADGDPTPISRVGTGFHDARDAHGRRTLVPSDRPRVGQHRHRQRGVPQPLL